MKDFDNKVGEEDAIKNFKPYQINDGALTSSTPKSVLVGGISGSIDEWQEPAWHREFMDLKNFLESV